MVPQVLFRQSNRLRGRKAKDGAGLVRTAERQMVVLDENGVEESRAMVVPAAATNGGLGNCGMWVGAVLCGSFGEAGVNAVVAEKRGA